MDKNRNDPPPEPWARPTRLLQPTLFPMSPDEMLAHARVSRDDLMRWRTWGWVSFEIDGRSTLDAPELAEICFVRNIARSGLSDQQITDLLSELPKPYRYDPTRVAYSFAFGWVQTPTHSESDEPSAVIEEHLDEWIDELARSGEGARLMELKNKVEDALIDAVENTVAQKRETDE